jgi:integrase
LSNITYEIITTEIKPYTYRTPLIAVDDCGELAVDYSKVSPVHIKKLTLLNMAGRDSSGKVVTFEPLEQANRFLMAHHIDDHKQESDQYSKGLVHFFSFLIKVQELWDSEYDEDVFDELTDLPRPKWDYMAKRKAQRITYQYRQALKDAVLKENNPDLKLARTTATAYMNAVIKFYSFHLRQGYKFNNPPFDHEIININFQASGTNMKGYMSKAVHTTDLRLNFPRSKRNSGGTTPSPRKDIRPLTNTEWKEVEDILLKTKTIIKNVSGVLAPSKLAIEYSLFFLVSRFTGLRREEVASLHKGQIAKPDHRKPILRIGVGEQYGSLTKTRDGNNKSRKTIIPASTMQMLYDYTRTERYQKRQKKFKELCKSKREAGDVAFFDAEDGVDESKEYIFISSTGKPFFTKLSDLNARWGEIRATVKANTGRTLDATIHNLRATFAVALFRALLRKTTPDMALAQVSALLGHDDESTTLLYLKIAQDEPTGDEVYEDILDFIGVFDDICTSENLLIHEGRLNEC